MAGLLLIIFLFPMLLESCLGINWPKPTDTIKRKNTLKITKRTDCGGKMYIPDGSKNWGKGEFMYPVIEVADGVKISNCMVQGGDGIHCLGRCTLENCWVENVKDDAISLFGTSSKSKYNVTGGGARNVGSKAIQFNGAGKLFVNNYYIQNTVEGIRSCGNCEDQYHREIKINGLTIVNLKTGQYVVGVNSNYNDKASLRNICIIGSTNVYPCKVFEGNENQGNPKVIQSEKESGGDGKYCDYKSSDIHIGS
ncbi:hypothetical protein ACQ4LE_008379 [Meloidogyne hapla]|uniref:Probable pectate lyase F n=1 Tax=Meloidogyne hapla TaxID=6305 RepID=A0A1I8B8G8_MELHA